jgi:isoleucyl-tRNA synthetase
MKRVNTKEKARQRELRVLAKWKEEDAFQQSVDRRKGAPRFVFYEGPPTANGLPHIGHVLGRVIKDFICRYRTMRGYQVVRRAGWDTHGLPVELGVEKQLGISGKQEIEAYGIEQFVKKCKESVFTFEKEWRKLTEAIGYWTDLDRPYITLTDDYIETVWHLLATIHRKGYLYQGHRVSPYCPHCQTTLSSHEVDQGYQSVKDLSATVKFKRTDAEEYFLAWTTTPWTLPANAALAVHPDLTYVKVSREGEVYIVAESLVEEVFGERSYEVLSTHRGDEFVGLRYEPPFSFARPEKGHVVIGANFVSDTSGTGIVHIAPAHGEDDHRVARENDISLLLVVDKAGRYTEEVTPWKGQFVKDCDLEIVKQLAHDQKLFSKKKIEHRYPYCWRCKTPLLYYATESWFIKTTAVKDQMIANNKDITWYPSHVRDGLFGNFLENLVDWNISRNRYWGTPLNVWQCTDCGHEHAVESRAELQKMAIGEISSDLELHKPYVDEVQLACPHCSGTMKRTPEVIDVWFDSGSMPFAQYHYPFENHDKWEEQYPADMIVEGVDQTRGWFFSLLAVSTLYNGRAPYKAVLSTGHVLDEHGQKMSKSLGNVVDTWEIIDEFGSDAFRWALFSDSVPWNNKRFSNRIVAEAKSKVIDTLVNTHAFYALYADIDQYSPEKYPYRPSRNRLDRWILSRMNSVLREVRAGLDENDLLGPARRLEAFIDDLSNWYIRRSRNRFWGSGMTEDKMFAYQTLREVLVKLSQMIAPYAPFIAEEIYQNLSGELPSVHHCDYPEVDVRKIDPVLEEEMQAVRQVVELARSVRNETGIKTRQPLSELLVVSEEPLPLEADLAVIQDEVNVKQVRQLQDDQALTQSVIKLNLKLAGPKFGKAVGQLRQYLQQLAPQEADAIAQSGELHYQTAEGEKLHLTHEYLLIEKEAKPGFATASHKGLTVALNTHISEALAQEGFVREVIRLVQEQRKRLDLPVEKRIRLTLHLDEKGRQAVEAYQPLLQENVLLHQLQYGEAEGMTQHKVGKQTVGIAVE